MDTIKITIELSIKNCLRSLYLDENDIIHDTLIKTDFGEIITNFTEANCICDNDIRNYYYKKSIANFLDKHEGAYFVTKVNNSKENKYELYKHNSRIYSDIIYFDSAEDVRTYLYTIHGKDYLLNEVR